MGRAGVSLDWMAGLWRAAGDDELAALAEVADRASADLLTIEDAFRAFSDACDLWAEAHPPGRQRYQVMTDQHRTYGDGRITEGDEPLPGYKQPAPSRPRPTSTAPSPPTWAVRPSTWPS